MTVSAIYSSGRIPPLARVIKVRLDNHIQQRTDRNVQQSISSRLSHQRKDFPISSTPLSSPVILSPLSSLPVCPWHGRHQPRPAKKDKIGVVDGHATSFTRNLSGDQKEAAETSSLWAQFVANAKYNRVTQLEDWFKEYTGNLNIAGWVGQGGGFDSLDKAGVTGSGDKVVTLLMEKEGYSQTDIALLQRTVRLRRKLMRTKRHVVFSVSAHSYNTSGFDGDILFFSFSSDEVHYRYSFESLTLSVELWDGVKDAPLKPS
ncbi:hypothetical protein PISMIDRAFT_24487 [Pisolithus microcarpus 441]|uniref:Uncharacterized protein n=1 Tax=Pisolithus microcarpus 441 TaxID=765257 RepID=A0A0C9YRE1_9AGAM|nr:hypothetical protein BKA83DRAFT_24487 [Pisolithus microcarpus]KIK19221.1 hypothetical protein PISMIDRAFT_24487 [Pisolithus microcarpus 441]